MTSQTLGSYLKAVRLAAGLPLRAVQEKTQGRVKNGYLSQIESGLIRTPSPAVLHDLAGVYGLSYDEIMRLAGHPVDAPVARASKLPAAIAGIPTAALQDLDASERDEVLSFLAFLKARRVSA